MGQAFKFNLALRKKLEAQEKELEQDREFVSYALHKNDEREIAAMKDLGMDITKGKGKQ